jgi:hypothetical protein
VWSQGSGVVAWAIVRSTSNSISPFIKMPWLAMANRLWFVRLPCGKD